LIQPLDTCLNKPLKDIVRSKFQLWFDKEGSKPENQTKKGYVRPPPTDLMIDWILDSCSQIPSSLIEKSFKHCSISLINKKLLTKEKIQDFLSQNFIQKCLNPYNDKAEIESNINSSQAMTFELEDTEKEPINKVPENTGVSSANQEEFVLSVFISRG